MTIKERIICCIGNVQQNRIHLVAQTSQSYVSIVHRKLGYERNDKRGRSENK